MPTIRERVNAHLPIVLQSLSTVSLIVIALSAVCGSQSLKRLSQDHDMHASTQIEKDQTFNANITFNKIL